MENKKFNYQEGVSIWGKCYLMSNDDRVMFLDALARYYIQSKIYKHSESQGVWLNAMCFYQNDYVFSNDLEEITKFIDYLEEKGLDLSDNEFMDYLIPYGTHKAVESTNRMVRSYIRELLNDRNEGSSDDQKNG